MAETSPKRKEKTPGSKTNNNGTRAIAMKKRNLHAGARSERDGEEMEVTSNTNRGESIRCARE